MAQGSNQTIKETMTQEEQKVSDLFNPRYKFMLDFPDYVSFPENRFFTVGDIIELKVFENGEKWAHLKRKDKYSMKGEFKNCDNHFFDKYPHLFQPLPWYAERKESEMPEYIKMIKGSEEFKPGIYKIEKYDIEDNFVCADGKCSSLSFFVPATHEEYLQYIKNKP